MYPRKSYLKIYNNDNNSFTEKEGLIRGIVYISEDYIEYGWFSPSYKNISIFLEDEEDIIIGISKDSLDGLIWSNKEGSYIISYPLTKEAILRHTQLKGNGKFPYTFPKHYEAVNNFSLFNGKEEVLESVEYPLSKYLNYTFGLEFETSMGYIPQEKCFRDGLIPLRDGSISGIEYSTTVLEGNKGLNLLYQQLSTLKEYTAFNKECALHIHMGGYPVTSISIFSLYSLWYLIERELDNESYVPPFTFNTSQYKNNKKDYCNKLPLESNFSELFEWITGKHYLGSLVQPHPCDIEKRAKWNIKSRYYGLNLVNMVCYSGPKTVEFRFLRPTYNYRKITLWLYVLNAVLQYAEHLATEWRNLGNSSTVGMLKWIRDNYCGISFILKNIYDRDTANYVISELSLLRRVVRNQVNNGDYYGRDTALEDELFT
jgi:hypothetical protein